LNLLSNAVKFTARGKVALRVEVAEDQGDQVLLRFRVKDSGIGIPTDLQDQLFQPFSQGDSSTTRRFGGTGLGLAICKRLVELMGGAIGVESVEGKGSVFWFTLARRRGSRAAVANPDRAQLLPVTQQKRPKGGRVLLVEDNMANQMVATLLLEKLGYLWDVVANGIEALDAIGRASYDIILMDCDMPQMDGFQATQEVRKREQGTGAHVPIIAMTANAMQGDRERCLAAGMDDYMTKPISREDLKAALDQWQ
jgi:CheY-like chemotaxis protein/anti-sigma regulatory factor (Ser/Thr protein kinase)